MTHFSDDERNPGESEPSNTRGEGSTDASANERMAPNRIAALIDSRLSGGERERLVDLVGETDAAGVLSDAVAALADVQATAPPAPAESAQRRAARRWHPGVWMALAAGIVGILLIPFAWSRAHRATHGGPERYAALVVAHGTRIPSGWDDTPWDVTRGSAELTPEARAFRIGVRVTDLGVAVRQGDSTASRYAAEIAALVGEIPGAAPVSAAYRRVAMQRAGSLAAHSALVDSATRAMRMLSRPDVVRLGAWVEAARLAAVAGDTSFFESPETRDVLGEVTRSRLPETFRGAIEPLHQVINRPNSFDWTEIQSELRQAAGTLGE